MPLTKISPLTVSVVSFNDIAYAQSCGHTGHHYKDGLAYKFEDDLHESLLQYIEWTPAELERLLR